MRKKYYTIKQVSEKLGISRQRVNRLVLDRGLNPMRIGRAYAMTSADIARLRKRKNGRPKKKK